MRNTKYLLAFVLIFSLVLSACSSAGDEQGQATESLYPGFTETVPLENENTGLDNDNANVNDNDNNNTNTGDADMGTATPTLEGGLGTPAGTAVGGTEQATAMATPMGTAVGGADLTQTPEATVEPGFGTGTPSPDDMVGDEGTFTNGILLSELIGAPVVWDDGTSVDGMGDVNANGNDNANANANANTNTGVDANTNADTGLQVTGTPGIAGTPDTAITGGVEAGDEVGVVGSVIVDQASCRIQYVLVSSDLDGRLIPVPLSVFYDRGQTGTLSMPLTLNIDQNLWTGAPGWDAGALPDMTVGGWDADLNSYWAGYTTGGTGGMSDTNANANDNTNTTGAVQTGAGAVRVTDATDLNVTNAAGDDLGDIEDFVIDLRGQEISYAILARGGLLDLGEDLVPIPCDRITWQWDGDNPTVVLDVDEEMLQSAPTIDELPNAYDEGWDAEWTTYWDAQ